MKIKSKEKSIYLIFNFIWLITITSTIIDSSPFPIDPCQQSDAVRTAALNNYYLVYNYSWGGPESEFSNAIALNTSGDLYFVGATESFSDNFDNFLAKYSNAGYIEWIEIWGGDDDEQLTDLALDSSGNIYVTGYNDEIANNKSNAHIAKYNSSGHSLMNITWGGPEEDVPYGIALDPSGNIYITGLVGSFGSGFDAFIAKFNSTGHSKMNITWGGSDTDTGDDIVLDPSGNIYITGYTKSFGAGEEDAYIAKFNSSGHSQMNITWGGSTREGGHDIELDTSGNIYIAGRTNSFGSGADDVFISKYSSVGVSLNNITWGGTSSEYPEDMTLDSTGNIYITGKTYSFGTGGEMVFLKFNNAGTCLDSTTWGGTDFEGGRGIDLDDSGNVYISLNSWSFGIEQVFLTKYSPISEDPGNGNGEEPETEDDDTPDDPFGIILTSLFVGISIGGIAGIVIGAWIKENPEKLKNISEKLRKTR